MPTRDWLSVREAWSRALYGPDGFYLSERPADHFRTSSHASAVFAEAVARLAGIRGVGSVVELGAGAGELLTALDGLAPDLNLLGVDLRMRPEALPPGSGGSALHLAGPSTSRPATAIAC